MSMSEITAEISSLHMLQSADEQMDQALTEQLNQMRKDLELISERRRLVRVDVMNRKRIISDKAVEKAKVMEEQQAEELIAATAEKVWDICKEYQGWIKAHDYQKEDIISSIHAYLIGHNGFLNANDLGLGKTMESFVAVYIIKKLYLAEHGKEPRILWLTKSSILKTGGTVREGQRWFPELKLVSLDGSQPKAERDALFGIIKMIKEAAVITNYETVRTTPALHDINWGYYRHG